MQKNTLLNLLFLLAFCSQSFGQYTISSVPDPKSRGGDYFVSDPDDLIEQGDEAEIDRLCRRIKRATQAEVAVIALGSIGDAVPADFAAGIAAHWGVGRAGVEDGVVVLMVKDQRRVEFWVGTGNEGIFPHQTRLDIQQSEMIPHFKADNYSAGMLAGVQGIARIFMPTENISTGSDENRFNTINDWNAAHPKMLGNKQEWLFDADTLYDKKALKAATDALRKQSKTNTFSVRWLLMDNSRLNCEQLDILAQMTHTQWKLSQDDILVVYDRSEKNCIGFYDSLPARLAPVKNQLYYLLRHYASPDKIDSTGLAYVDSVNQQIFRLWLDETFRNKLLEEKKSAEELIRMMEEKERRERELYNENVYGNTDGSSSSVQSNLLWGWIYITSIFSLFTLLYTSAVLMMGKNPYNKYNLLTFFVLKIWIIIFLIPYIGIWYWLMHLRKKLRDTPRNSPKTGRPMRKLSEQEEDAFLQAGNNTEEAINSVHYDVWASEQDGDIMILKYPIWFSGYGQCPSCKFKTYFKEYDRTITPATEYSTGTGERKYACKHCRHTHRQTYTIPRITRNKSSSSGGSSGGGWGGGGSSGSSSGSSW